MAIPQQQPTTVQAPKSVNVKESRKAAQELGKIGEGLLASMPEDRKATLGSLRDKLHFITLLGLESRTQQRRLADGSNEPCATPVGLLFKTDVDLEVPVIDVRANVKVGVTADQIGSRTVKAGEQFMLTYLEYMFLIVRDEFLGFCSYNGDPLGCFLVTKMPQYVKNEAKLPTPTANISSGAIKADILPIDEQVNGTWKIKAEYAEKFGPLLEKRQVTRSNAKATNTPTPVKVSLALQGLLADAIKVQE